MSSLLSFPKKVQSFQTILTVFFLAVTFGFLKAAETEDVDKPPHSSLVQMLQHNPRCFKSSLQEKPQILLCPESPAAAFLPLQMEKAQDLGMSQLGITFTPSPA